MTAGGVGTGIESRSTNRHKNLKMLPRGTGLLPDAVECRQLIGSARHAHDEGHWLCAVLRCCSMRQVYQVSQPYLGEANNT